MTINGKTIKVINAPVLHCKNCNSIIISDEVKEKAKEFSEVYLYPDNTLDYAECEAGTVMSVMNLLFNDNKFNNFIFRHKAVTPLEINRFFYTQISDWSD